MAGARRGGTAGGAAGATNASVHDDDDDDACFLSLFRNRFSAARCITPNGHPPPPPCAHDARRTAVIVYLPALPSVCTVQRSSRSSSCSWPPRTRRCKAPRSRPGCCSAWTLGVMGRTRGGRAQGKPCRRLCGPRAWQRPRAARPSNWRSRALTGRSTGRSAPAAWIAARTRRRGPVRPSTWPRACARRRTASGALAGLPRPAVKLCARMGRQSTKRATRRRRVGCTC